MLGLGRVTTLFRNRVKQFDVTDLEIHSWNTLHLVDKEDHDLFLHSNDALSNDIVDRDAGCLVHLARFPNDLNHLWCQRLSRGIEAKDVFCELQDLLVIVLAGEDDFEGTKSKQVLENLDLTPSAIVLVR